MRGAAHHLGVIVTLLLLLHMLVHHLQPVGRRCILGALGPNRRNGSRWRHLPTHGLARLTWLAQSRVEHVGEGSLGVLLGTIWADHHLLLLLLLHELLLLLHGVVPAWAHLNLWLAQHLRGCSTHWRNHPSSGTYRAISTGHHHTLV